MSGQAWVIVGLAALLLLVAAYAAVLHRRLHARVEQHEVRHEPPLPPAAPATDPAPAGRDVDYVITTVGGDAAPAPTVPDRVVLSATLGEPLVKAVALAHGLRRALSPASRNRIRFEVRQEVRRSRKVRRAEMRTAWREMKARERGRPGETAAEGVEGAA